MTLIALILAGWFVFGTLAAILVGTLIYRAGR